MQPDLADELVTLRAAIATIPELIRPQLRPPRPDAEISDRLAHPMFRDFSAQARDELRVWFAWHDGQTDYRSIDVRGLPRTAAPPNGGAVSIDVRGLPGTAAPPNGGAVSIDPAGTDTLRSVDEAITGAATTREFSELSPEKKDPARVPYLPIMTNHRGDHVLYIAATRELVIWRHDEDVPLELAAPSLAAWAQHARIAIATSADELATRAAKAALALAWNRDAARRGWAECEPFAPMQLGPVAKLRAHEVARRAREVAAQLARDEPGTAYALEYKAFPGIQLGWTVIVKTTAKAWLQAGANTLAGAIEELALVRDATPTANVLGSFIEDLEVLSYHRGRLAKAG